MEQSRDNGCCSSCHLILHQPYIGKRIYTDASAIFFESDIICLMKYLEKYFKISSRINLLFLKNGQ